MSDGNVWLDLVQGAASGVGVELGGVDLLLGLLHLLVGALERRPLPLEALLGGGELALGGLAALGLLLAGAALGGLAILGLLPSGRRGRRGGADQPDRRGALLARQPAALDRLSDLGIAGGGLQRLADPGEDLRPDP